MSFFSQSLGPPPEAVAARRAVVFVKKALNGRANASREEIQRIVANFQSRIGDRVDPDWLISAMKSDGLLIELAGNNYRVAA